MKRALIYASVGAILVVVGFFAGEFCQHQKTGYHFEVREQKLFRSPLGKIEWSYVTESVGMPFLDPGTTIIKFEDRTIYKAQRYFQEDYPYARNIQTNDNSIMWEDGEFKFQLTIESLTNSPAVLQPKTTN
jgi:hypothetical protein